MKSKPRNQSFIFIAIATVLLILATVLIPLTPKMQSDATIRKIEKNIVDNESTYEELISIMGSEGKNVGSGFFIAEWKLPDGRYIHAWIIGQGDSRTVSAWKVMDKATPS